MYDFQKTLRRTAQFAVEQQGAEAEPVRGTGGHRLKIRKNGREQLALVRTSRDRWVGWMRKNGEFRGFDDADVIITAALDDPATPTKVEVFGFDPEEMRGWFNQNLAARAATSPVKPTAPVFICLDTMQRNVPADTASGFKEKALWRVELPIDPAMAAAAGEERDENGDAVRSTDAPQPPETTASFGRRVLNEFAALVGMPPEKVTVQFSIIP